ncbi:MAG: response regulator [Lachnospiraceae bacterium]|nr:response regulator [Lachnospiraceae bacterium]MDE7205406.1 response regulator [Lachnospiraceae bacterium]
MSIKLLIADDEDIIRNGIAKYIQLHTDRFDKIYLAANGQEAVDIIFRDKPDIMFLDVQMPLMDGIEVMQEAKRAGILPYTMILSGYDEFKYCQQALRLGAKEYLLKPVRSSDILQMVNRVADELFGKQEEAGDEPAEEKNHLVELAKEYVEEHYYENLMLADVAQKVGISAGYLSTLFQKQLSKGFIDYLNEVRIEYACTYLQQNYLKTYEIAYKVGFKDEKYFSKVFKKIKGQSPSEYRKSVL